MNAEEILLKKIQAYNEIVSIWRKFTLEQRHMIIFTEAMEQYASLRVAESNTQIIEKIDVLIANATEQERVFELAGMNTSASCSGAMAAAYKVVKELIEPTPPPQLNTHERNS